MPIFILLTLLLHGCVSPKNVTQNNQPPAWIKQIPTSSRFDYHVGKAYGIKNKRQAIESANADARFQVIRERFGIKTSIQKESIETMDRVEYKKRFAEGGDREYHLKGLSQEDAFFNGDTAWVLVKIPKQKKSQTDFWIGVKNSNISKVVQSSNKGENINQKNDRGEIALHVAASKGDLKMIKVLIQKGSDPNIQNSYGCSAAHLAAKNYHHEVVEYLVNNGTNATLICQGEESLFVRLASTRRYKMIQYLLDKGINPDSSDANGKTALIGASQTGDKKMAKFLLEKGADPDKADKLGKTPLHHSATKGKKDFVVLLIERGASPVSRDQNGRVPAQLASRKGHNHIKLFLSEIACQKGFKNYCQQDDRQRAKPLEHDEDLFEDGGIKELEI